jgi:hypothetical protein
MLREVGTLMLTGLVPTPRLDRFDRRQQHPRPARPQYSGESAVWLDEHVGNRRLPVQCSHDV